MLVIAAAGNAASDNDTHPEMPADLSNTYDNVIAVGASDASNRMASFSDYGQSVSLMAPGENMADITTMDWTGSTGQVIVWASGTSFAAPMVAAAAALIWSAAPALTYLQVKNDILSSVTKVPALAADCRTGGVLNVPAALAMVPEPVSFSFAGFDQVQPEQPATVHVLAQAQPGALPGATPLAYQLQLVYDNEGQTEAVPGDKLSWSAGGAQGQVTTDANGTAILAVPGLDATTFGQPSISLSLPALGQGTWALVAGAVSADGTSSYGQPQAVIFDVGSSSASSPSTTGSPVSPPSTVIVPSTTAGATPTTPTSSSAPTSTSTPSTYPGTTTATTAAVSTTRPSPPTTAPVATSPVTTSRPTTAPTTKPSSTSVATTKAPTTTPPTTTPPTTTSKAPPSAAAPPSTTPAMRGLTPTTPPDGAPTTAFITTPPTTGSPARAAPATAGPTGPAAPGTSAAPGSSGAFVLHSISPSSLPVTGGQLDIFGSGVPANATVMIGSVPVPVIAETNIGGGATDISVQVPGAAAGVYDVVVTNPTGSASATLTGALAMGAASTASSTSSTGVSARAPSSTITAPQPVATEATTTTTAPPPGTPAAPTTTVGTNTTASPSTTAAPVVTTPPAPIKVPATSAPAPSAPATSPPSTTGGATSASSTAVVAPTTAASTTASNTVPAGMGISTIPGDAALATLPSGMWHAVTAKQLLANAGARLVRRYRELSYEPTPPVMA